MSLEEALAAEKAARLIAEEKLAKLESVVSAQTPELGLIASLSDSDDAVAVWSASQKLLAANASYYRLFENHPTVKPGIDYFDMLQLTYDESLIWPEGQQGTDWLRLMRSRVNDSKIPRVLLETKGGRLHRLVNRRTSFGGLFSILVDITNSIAEHRAVMAERDAAEHASRAKSAFLANMSHEIRTPMNGVVGMADLLCETALDDEQTLFAKTIRNSAEALLVIINDVLDYSKLEAEKLVLHPEPFDLEHLLHEVVMLLQPAANEKGVDILIDYDIFLPTRFTADPGRLRQIVTNILGNAVKFTDTGHVLIRVTGLELGDGEDMSLHIAVEDTGIGIPQKKLASIFGEFSQVEDADHRRSNGTGLGLAISKELVELMDGEIWVDSEVGQGSVFGFQIPVPNVQDNESKRPLLEQTPNSVLVVDDLEINRTILKKQLEALGIKVETSENGLDALQKCRDVSFDLVITDHLMPEKNGIELAQDIRAEQIKVPLVLLSSNPLAARQKSPNKLFDLVLQKPLARHALLSSLAHLEGKPPATTATLQSHARPIDVVSPPETPSHLRPMRVLLVEDNATNRLVFQKMVKDLNLELLIGYDGQEGIDAWRAHDPDLIFMDISMPVKDGYQACAEIRRTAQKHVPICALTAHIELSAERVVDGADFDQSLSKPVKKSALFEAISKFQPKDTSVLFNPICSDQAAAAAG